MTLEYCSLNETKRVNKFQVEKNMYKICIVCDFQIFISVAIVLEYGDPVCQKSTRADEMLNYLNNLGLIRSTN
jgi:hypothetical protein